MNASEAKELAENQGKEHIEKIKKEKLSMMLDQIKGYSQQGRCDIFPYIDKQYATFFEEELTKLGYRVSFIDTLGCIYIGWG